MMHYMNAVRRSFELISPLSLLAFFALLPVFFLPLPWVTLPESKVLLVVILLGVAILGWALSFLFNGVVRVPRAWILIVGLLLPIAYLISTILSGVASVSIVGSGVEQDTLAAACLWYLALSGTAFICSDAVIKGIYAVRALFAGLLVLDVLELVHLFAPSLSSFGGILSSQTANPLGGWYELGIISGLAVFLALACLSTPVSDGVWKKVLTIVAALSFALLVVINAREVWIGVAAVSVVYGLISVFAARHLYQIYRLHAWRPVLGWLALAGVAVLFVFFGTVVNGYLPSSFQISQTEVRPSWSGTLLVGSHALAQPSRLAFGAGPNTFMQEWALYKPVEVNQTVFWNTDFGSGIGSIPTSLISIGIFGGVAWALFVLMILVLMVRLVHSSPRQGASMLLEPLLLGVLFLIGFHILYVPGPALSILTFLLLGLAIGYATSLGRISHRSVSMAMQGMVSRMYVIIVFVFVFASVVTCLGVAQVITAEMLINKSVATYNTSGDLAKSTRLVSDALRIYPKDTRGQRAAIELGLLRIADMSSKSPMDDATAARLKSTIEDTIHYGLSAVAIDGDDYQNWLELANLYQQLAGANVGGAYENAQSAYAELIAKNPTNPLPYLQRARLELLQNHTDAALSDLSTAIRLKPDFAAAYYVASQVLTEQKDFQNALPAAKAATQYAPNDPLAWYNLGAVAYTATDYTDAVSALEHALSIEPQYANATYALGLSYYQLGRVTDSIKIFQQLSALDPSQTIIKDILANLEVGNSPFEQASATSTSPVKVKK